MKGTGTRLAEAHRGSELRREPLLDRGISCEHLLRSHWMVGATASDGTPCEQMACRVGCDRRKLERLVEPCWRAGTRWRRLTLGLERALLQKQCHAMPSYAMRQARSYGHPHARCVKGTSQIQVKWASSNFPIAGSRKCPAARAGAAPRIPSLEIRAFITASPCLRGLTSDR